MVGGTAGALQTDMPTSVANVFSDNPKGAMVVIGDFAPGVTQTTLEPETGYNVFTFPSIDDSPLSAVGGGDLFVEFKKSDAADAFLETYDARGGGDLGQAGGGFTSPNKNVPESAYPDPITQATATGLAKAEVFRFDLSDLQPAAFGDTGTGPLQALLGLREEPERHRLDHAADGSGREEGLRELGPPLRAR